MVIVKMAWDREEQLFMSVLAVLLKLLPLSKQAANSSYDDTLSSLNPNRLMLPFFSSLI